VAALFVAIGALWAFYPVKFYWSNRRLEEWMIYRLLLCGLLFTSAFGLLSASALADRILALVYRRPGSAPSLIDRLLTQRRLLWAAGLSAVIAVGIVWPGLVEYVRTGHVTVHWSRPMAAVFLIQLALLATVHAVLQKIVGLWELQMLHAAHRRHDHEPL
jgi:hypothetical protein